MVAAAACLATGGLARAEAPALAAETLVEGAQTAYTDVTLPAPLRLLDSDWKPLVRARIEGGGDYVAAELRELGTRGGFGPRGIRFMRMALDDGTSSRGWLATTGDSGLRLPSGRYRLYLFTQSQARITLELDALEGEATHRPSVPWTFGLKRLDPFPSAPGVSALGASGRLESTGDMEMLARFDPPAQTSVDRLEVCSYSGPEAAGPLAYQPGCPTGSGISIVRPLEARGWGVHASWSNFPADTYGLGVNLTHPGETLPGRGLAVWLSYDDEAPPLPDPAGTGTEPAREPLAPAHGTAAPTARRSGVRGGRASVPLVCSDEGPCTGSAQIVGGRTERFQLGAGDTATLRLPVPGRLLRILRRRGRASGRLSVREAAAAGLHEHSHRLTLTRR